MMKIYLYSISFVLWFYLGETTQPYFPPQIVFSPDNGQTIFAIDETNQRAFKTLAYGATGRETSYVMEHFPYSESDSPQSKYYVQLLIDSPPLGCMYGTYWKYGGNQFNSFPAHWWVNQTSFKVDNYIKFKYNMIHSTNSSLNEDYWYANVTCQTDRGEIYPCEEIYFQKNTQIPLRFTQVIRRGWDVLQVMTNYKIISMGKPEDKYFDSIPKNWTMTCRDVNLGLLYYPQSTNISLHQNVEIHIYLAAPPHQLNGTDTVRIQWKPTNCTDCVTWTPTELIFNTNNFQKEQILTITRVKNGPQTILMPIFEGGDYERVPPQIYPIWIQ
jgi:hypothetical protein